MPNKPGTSSGTPSHDTGSRVGRPGQRTGEWLLETPLGGGAFGEVWQARHHVWADQLAAVKLPTDPQYVRALQREGLHAHRLEHPNIVRPLGMDPFAETPYLVMEYVPGTDLRSLLRQGRLTPARSASILRQVLLGLAHAHDHGIVHRDIKPENILLHERGFVDPLGFDLQGTVKVTDFGLGKANLTAEEALGHAAAGAKSIVFSTDVSNLPPEQAQQIAGSLDYMAPEQRGGAAVDGRADLYACGVLLYEMLTGERPAGTDVPSDLNREVPAWLDEVFRRSYARLERRYESAAAFLAALSPAVPPPLPAKVPADVEGRLHTTGAVEAAAPGTCPSCRGRVDRDDQFCIHCGHQLVGQVRRCGKCGAFPAASDNYCMFCGNDLQTRHQVRTTDVTV